MINAIGLRSLAALSPQISLALSAIASAQGDAMAALAGVQTQLAAALAPPPLITPAEFALAVGEMISSFNPSAILLAIAEQAQSLTVQVGSLTAKVAALASVAASINALIGSGAAMVMTFEGLASVAGSEIGAQMTTDFAANKQVKSLVITVDDAIVWTAIKTLFGVT